MAFFFEITSLLDLDVRSGILDIKTPRHSHFAARFKRSHAYNMLVEKMPCLLNDLVQDLMDNLDENVKKYGEESREEFLFIIKKIKRLNLRMQNDNIMKPFLGQEPDQNIWNTFLGSLSFRNNSFYRTCLLYAECFIYRRITCYFENSRSLKQFNLFEKTKTQLFVDNLNSIEVLLKCCRMLAASDDALRLLLKISLWGTHAKPVPMDTKRLKSNIDPFKPIQDADKKILVDNSNMFCNILKSADHSKPVIIEIVCESCGYDLITDLIVADYIITQKLADKIRFNLKAINWFITDATINDFNCTIRQLETSRNIILQEFARRWTHFLEEGIFAIAPLEYFWTSPYEFYKMREINGELYHRLAAATLLILKGDLNYRKLIGDFCWDINESILTCVRGFTPTHIFSLRVIKTDALCGVAQDHVEQLLKKNKDWMTSGEYSTIHYIEKNYCGCSAHQVEKLNNTDTLTKENSTSTRDDFK